MEKKRIYVSSTFEDLKGHRAALRLALERAQFGVESMEKYPAFDKRPADKCLEDVSACDYYVLILGWRYGYVPKKSNPNKRSITHLEYERAVETKKPCFVFLLDPEHPWPPKFCDANALNGKKSRIGALREVVETEYGRALFTTPDNLANSVLQALRNHETGVHSKSDAR